MLTFNIFNSAVIDVLVYILVNVLDGLFGTPIGKPAGATPEVNPWLALGLDFISYPVIFRVYYLTSC